MYGFFLLPGCLQVDLSFTPQQEFGPKNKHFNLLFGNHTGVKEITPIEPIEEIFGLIIHHTLRTKVSIERGNLSQARDWFRKAWKYAKERGPIKTDKSYFHSQEILLDHLSKIEILNSLKSFIDNLHRIKDLYNESHDKILATLEDLKK